jgi:hypothetical protein
MFPACPADRRYLGPSTETERGDIALPLVFSKKSLAVIGKSAVDSLLALMHCYRTQFHFIRFCLCFHIVERLRYLWESYHSRQRTDRLTQ